jgi:hypothetical protein
MTAVTSGHWGLIRTSETLTYFLGLTPARWGLVQLPSGPILTAESGFGNDWKLFREDCFDFLCDHLVL